MTNPQDISMGIYGILNGTVSDNVYDETAPNKLPDNCTDFVIYDLGSFKPAYDYDSGSISRGFVSIHCFAKNKSNGIKNTAKLKLMADACTNAINTNILFRASLSEIQVTTRGIGDFHGQTIIYNILN